MDPMSRIFGNNIILWMFSWCASMTEDSVIVKVVEMDKLSLSLSEAATDLFSSDRFRLFVFSRNIF